MKRSVALSILAALVALILIFNGCGSGSSTQTVIASDPPPTPTPTPAPATSDPQDVLTWHNDLARTGQDLNETVLTPANVNAQTFGRKFVFNVDGYVYGQPLIANGVTIAGAKQNVVYVVTAHGSVYAFDADGKTTSPLWHDQLFDEKNGIIAPPGSDLGVGDEWGIISTPVIDRSRNLIYVLSRTKNTNNNTFHHYIHALDLVTGAEKTGQPVEISACVPGTGYDASNGQVCFNPKTNNNRVSLALVNNVVYAGWASLEDVDPYHGWIMGFDADSLKMVATFTSTPNGSRGGYWMAGAAPVVDPSGNLYYVCGNGTVDQDKKNYGETALKLSYANSALTIADYFTPFNWAALEPPDLDLGSGGIVTLPDHYLAFAGKEGRLHIVDRSNMGKFQSGSDSQIVQEIPKAFPSGLFATGAYWNGNVYYVGNADVIKQFSWSNGKLSSTPVASGATTTYWFPGATPGISANGTTNAIVWAVERTSGNRAILHAYDATNVSHELYNSAQNASRDDAGAAVKFVVPTISNGKVYVGAIDRVDVYGLL